MTGTEQKIFEIISDKEKVSIFEIAQKMGISTDYTRLICQGLKRHNDIDISGNYCSISKPPVLMVRQAHHKKEEKIITQKISKKNEASPPQGAGLPLEKEAGKKRKKQKMDSFSNLKTVNKETAKILRKAGYETIKDIVRTPFPIFMQKTGIELSRAAKIFNEAKKKIGMI